MFGTTLKQALQNQKREEGQGLVEYALILVLVAVVVIVVLSLVGPAVGNIFSEVVSALNNGPEIVSEYEDGYQCEGWNGALSGGNQLFSTWEYNGGNWTWVEQTVGPAGLPDCPEGVVEY